MAVRTDRIKMILGCLIILLTGSGGLHAQVNKGMPDIQDVFEQFFYHYQKPAVHSYVQFQKRPDGWYVDVLDFHGKEVLGPNQLFWDKRQGTFFKLDYPSASNMSTEGVQLIFDEYTQSIITDLDLYNFRHDLYYGYNGWDEDIIHAVESDPNPTDSLLESMARAYCNYAIYYFYNQYGFTRQGDDPDRTILADNEPISITRAEKFAACEQKALATYRRLLKANPGYKTIVGNVALQLSNQTMFAYSTLIFNGFAPQADAFLPDVTYSDSILAKADSILAFVKPNSILFTTGDNVLFPIWYRQAKGIRTDIIVMDYGLLGLRRYVTYLDRRYHHSLFTADSTVYIKKSFDYSLFDAGRDLGRPQRVDSFLRSIYQQADSASPKFFTRQIYVDIDTLKAAHFYHRNDLYSSIPLAIRKSYLVNSEMLEFDILQTNLLKRHIYFSFPTDDDNYNKYLIDNHDYVWEFAPIIHNQTP